MALRSALTGSVRTFPALAAAALAAGCSPEPPDWRVDASRAVPWTPPAGRSSCPQDDTLRASLELPVVHRNLLPERGDTAPSREQAKRAWWKAAGVPAGLALREIVRRDPCRVPASRTWIVQLLLRGKVVDTLVGPLKASLDFGPGEVAPTWRVASVADTCLGAWAEAHEPPAPDEPGALPKGALGDLPASGSSLGLRRDRGPAFATFDPRNRRLVDLRFREVCP